MIGIHEEGAVGVEEDNGGIKRSDRELAMVDGWGGGGASAGAGAW